MGGPAKVITAPVKTVGKVVGAVAKPVAKVVGVSKEKPKVSAITISLASDWFHFLSSLKTEWCMMFRHRLDKLLEHE